MKAPPGGSARTRALARLRRTVEANPARADIILVRELTPLIDHWVRFEEEDPAGACEAYLEFAEFLADMLERCEDTRGEVAALFPRTFERIQTRLLLDAQRGGSELDAPILVQRLLRAWLHDGAGHFEGLEEVFLQVAEETVYGRLLEGEVGLLLQNKALVFPAAPGEALDPRRMVLHLERRGLERLMGELLALRGQHDYCLKVAEEHFERTGDALDLVRVLERAGEWDRAAQLAREALEDPRSSRREALQQLFESCLDQIVVAPDREQRRELEREFLERPSTAGFQRLLRSVDPAHWPHVRDRVLGHLQRHRRAVDLVFNLRVEAGDIVEADGMVVTLPIHADALVGGADRIRETHPAQAAGWLLVAAHRRASTSRGRGHSDGLTKDLDSLRELAAEAGELEAFESALERMIQHFKSDAGLVATIRRMKGSS